MNTSIEVLFEPLVVDIYVEVLLWVACGAMKRDETLCLDEERERERTSFIVLCERRSLLVPNKQTRTLNNYKTKTINYVPTCINGVPMHS